MADWANFDRDEFKCSHCGRNEIKDEYIDVVQDIRTETGYPMPVNSGYRCPDHPEEAKKRKPGSHTLGLVSDIGVSGSTAFAVLQAALAEPEVTAIGISQKGKAKNRFIHIGIDPQAEGRPRPWLWSY